MRLGFFLKEAFRALSRNAAPSLAATLTILLTALTLGVFIPIVQATTGTANEVRGRLLVDVYVRDGATPQQKAQLRQRLDSTANVKKVQFVSKAQGLKEARKKNPDAFKEGTQLLGSNPLPDVFRVTPVDPGKVEGIVNALAPRDAQGARRPVLAQIDEVRNRESETNKILSATSLVKTLTAGLMLLLIVASIALVANTVRLSIFARRREVEVMKLVGATNWFIRWPFVIEGVMVGFLGGVVAVLLLAIAKTTFVDPLSKKFDLLATPNTIDFPLLVVVLLICSMTVSAIGSGLTLRRFLRV
jgi:cell division transport system permease protein